MEQTLEQQPENVSVTDHDSLSPDDVAAYLDGNLKGDDLTRVESYLSQHPSARDELIGVARVIATVPPSSRNWMKWLPGAAGLAAAAALIAFLVRPGSIARESATIPIERSEAGEAASTIQLIAPGQKQVLTPPENTFAWRSVEGAAYRFVISDAAGNTLVQQTLSDTVIVVPSSRWANARGTLYWSVDALSADGTSVTSGLRDFEVTRR